MSLNNLNILEEEKDSNNILKENNNINEIKRKNFNNLNENFISSEQKIENNNN